MPFFDYSLDGKPRSGHADFAYTSIMKKNKI